MPFYTLLTSRRRGEKKRLQWRRRMLFWFVGERRTRATCVRSVKMLNVSSLLPPDDNAEEERVSEWAVCETTTMIVVEQVETVIRDSVCSLLCVGGERAPEPKAIQRWKVLCIRDNFWRENTVKMYVYSETPSIARSRERWCSLKWDWKTTSFLASRANMKREKKLFANFSRWKKRQKFGYLNFKCWFPAYCFVLLSWILLLPEMLAVPRSLHRFPSPVSPSSSCLFVVYIRANMRRWARTKMETW